MKNPQYASDFAALDALCRERQAALQTIKSIARRPWSGRPRTWNTYFYEPLETQSAIDQAVHWVLGRQDIFVITAGDMQLLPMMLEAASRFEKQPSEAEMAALAELLDIQPIFA